MTKVEDEIVIEIDPATGLPVVTDGYYWRVTDGKTWMDSHMAPAFGRYIHTGPQVELRRKFTEDQTKNVYGVWPWNKNKIIRKYTVQVERDHTIIFKKFEGWAGDKAPEVAVNVQGRVFDIRFDIQQTAEGIAWIADKIWRGHAVLEATQKARNAEAEKKRQKAEKEKAELEEFKSTFYGDYPPKTLVDA